MLSPVSSEYAVKTIRDGIMTMKSRLWSRMLMIRELDEKSGLPGWGVISFIHADDAVSGLFDKSLFGKTIFSVEMQYQFPGYAIEMVVGQSKDGYTNIDADVIEAISDFFNIEV